KKVQRDGIHLVLVRLVERSEGVPITLAARLDDFCADLAIAQTHNQIIGRRRRSFSSLGVRTPQIRKTQTHQGAVGCSLITMPSKKRIALRSPSSGERMVSSCSIDST